MVSGLAPSELLDLYQTARQVVWRYNLDKMETSALRTAMRSTEKAAKDILSQPTEKLKRWEQLRRQDLIREIDSVALGIREQVAGEISSLAGQAGAESAKYHSQTMSLGGKVQGFNNVALSPEQFRSFFQTTPLGGATLNQWVNRAFDATVRQGILEDLGAGVLQGKGYRGLVDNIMGHMEGFTRKEAVTLARSFVQQANVTANDAVMAANRDIIKRWKWSAVLEGGNMASGNGTCIRCACLDQQEFEFGEGPPMVLHPRCRCVKLPVLVSYRDLGIDVDELEEVARPWTERPDIPIGEGGRNITSWGTHKGEYASWFNSRGEQFQKNVVGPKRLALIQSGKVTFKDLVDPNTGRLYRLDELVGGPRGGGAAVPRSILPTPKPYVNFAGKKEALAWGAERFITEAEGRGFNIKGLPLEAINDINKGLNDSIGLYGIKIKSIGALRGKKSANASFSYPMDKAVSPVGWMNVKTSYAKDPLSTSKKTQAIFESRKNERIDYLRQAVDDPRRKALKEGNMQRLREFEAMERWSFSSVADKPLYNTMLHEGGHAVDFQYGLSGKFTKIMEKNNVTGLEKLKVAEYGAREDSELFAEVFNAVASGKQDKVPPSILKSFAEVMASIGGE